MLILYQTTFEKKYYFVRQLCKEYTMKIMFHIENKHTHKILMKAMKKIMGNNKFLDLWIVTMKNSTKIHIQLAIHSSYRKSYYSLIMLGLWKLFGSKSFQCG